MSTLWPSSSGDVRDRRMATTIICGVTLCPAVIWSVVEGDLEHKGEMGLYLPRFGSQPHANLDCTTVAVIPASYLQTNWIGRCRNESSSRVEHRVRGLNSYATDGLVVVGKSPGIKVQKVECN